MPKAAMPEMDKSYAIYKFLFRDYLKTHASRVEELYIFDMLINDNKMKSVHIFNGVKQFLLHPN